MSGINQERSSAGMLGDFSPLDGSVEFYGRVSAFLRPEFTVVDLGAGRGGWYVDGEISVLQRSLRTLKGRVAKVIGVDVDAAVLTNPSTDENRLIIDGRLPLEDASADVVVADFVLEHLGDPLQVEAEVWRVLRPGGLFCARTPHALNYVSLGARIAGRSRRDRLLSAAQPFRNRVDIFDTRYRCNTMRQLKHVFRPSRWTSYSYLYAAEPSYDFGSKAVYSVLRLCHRLLPLPLVGNLFVFEVKR